MKKNNKNKEKSDSYLIIHVSNISEISRTLAIIKKNDKRADGIFSYSEYGASKEELEFFEKINKKIISNTSPLYKEIISLSNNKISAESKMSEISEDFAENKNDGEDYSKYNDKEKYCSARIKKILHNLVK